MVSRYQPIGSLYFEGAGGQTLGQLGHSNDHRPHLKVLSGTPPAIRINWSGSTLSTT
jgi:hypothetical protein